MPGNVGIDYGQFAEDKMTGDSSETRKTLANAFLDTEPEDYRKQLVISQFLDEKFKEEIEESVQVWKIRKKFIELMLLIPMRMIIIRPILERQLPLVASLNDFV